MTYTVRPISDRTAFTGDSVDSRFTVTWSQCLDLLGRELEVLGATDIVIEVDVAERGIGIDGQLRGDAKASSPAVRLAFESNVGPLTYATDAFMRPSYRRGGMRDDWQHNLYAITKSLEALRLVDRYGVTRRGEQYAGFKALPAGRAMPASHMTSDEAERIIRQTAYSDENSQIGQPIGTVYRRARAAAHPDRNDGDRTLWDQVEQAAVVLGMAS